MVDIEQVLKDLIEKFNGKAAEDEKLQRELENVTRKIMVEMKDGETYSFILKDKQLTDFSKGKIEAPDIRIVSDTKSFDALIKREMGPMRALATGKVKIEASLEDKLRFRKLL